LKTRFKNKSENTELKIAWTPLIDMVFILLLFFAVTTTWASKEAGMNMELPNAGSGTQQNNNQIIYVDELGRIYINNQDTPLSISDFLNELNRFEKDQPWEIRANKNVPYEKVIIVLDNLRKEKYMNVILAVEPNRN
tara:strand:+ start:13502 stop:13912 length:411 start_codon:yes stop_codon:yes gene_type:complete